MADIVGLRVRDPITQQVTIEISDRLSRVDNQIFVNGSNGSITLPSGYGEIFFSVSGQDAFEAQAQTPRVTRVANTISWVYANNKGRLPVTITYGYY